MKGYIMGFCVGVFVAFAIMMLVVETHMMINVRLEIRNQVLTKQKVELEYKLEKANKYIKTINNNFDHFRIVKDKEMEELRGKNKKFILTNLQNGDYLIQQQNGNFVNVNKSKLLEGK